MRELTVPDAKLPLSACVGRSVKCPNCGSPATVEPARHARTARGEVVASIYWMRVACSGHCGALLAKSTNAAEVLGEAPGSIDRRQLAASVGRWIKCPRCGERALACFRTDFAEHPDGTHAVQCPACQCRPYDPGTIVEVLGP